MRAGYAGEVQTCQRLHAEIFELTSMYTNKVGLPGPYAACALLGLASNSPAEPWLGVAPDDMAAIKTTLRQHHLLTPWSEVQSVLPIAART